LRRKTVFLSLIGLALASLTAVFALSSPGSQSDPLVPLSYINERFIPGILNEANSRTETKFNPIFDKAVQDLEDKRDGWLLGAENAALYSAVLKKIGASATAGFSDVAVKRGDVITGKPGTGMMIRSGAAAIVGPAGGVLINVTVGAERSPGSATAADVYYMVASNDGTGLKVTSDTGVVAISGEYRITPAYTARYQKVAEALNSLSLFQGTPTGYQLDRAATRMEALVMLIRLLGEEEEAMGYTGANPFTDVPEWAVKYGAYAFSKGYTAGTSSGRFTPDTDVTAAQYMTFLLRALSYSDASGDFNWQQSLDFSVEAGILTQAEKINLQGSAFYRDQVVFASYKALFAKVKDGNTALSQKLISAGVFTEDGFNAAVSKAGLE